MKELHLICNAHIDPIWQWPEDEGMSAALSTFRSAVGLADRFDYIFCHNEAMLYRAVEEYAPELFASIRALVAAGKWHIMGGWYLQPDCNMPTGESFVRQIQTGLAYFEEKFGVRPEVAVNFDPFGHTRGLVQIMAKCGQTGYMICRPAAELCDTGGEQFVWEGFDGSRVKVNRSVAYNTPLGSAAEAIEQRAEAQKEDVCCVLWGVGNHGGGPSAKDLADIGALAARRSDWKISHSTPEAFFARIRPETVFSRSLHISMPGCYTSMGRVKAAHAALESTLYATEKMCSAASVAGLMEYPARELGEAAECLMSAEFHDVLPGTCVRSGEESGLRALESGLRLAERARTRAFFALTGAERAADDGEYPIFAFNPNPYPLCTELTAEFMLADQNWKESEVSDIRVYGEDGAPLPAQTVKEESNLDLDWRKKVAVYARLKPLALTRLSARVTFAPKRERSLPENLVFEDGEKRVEIDRATGLLKAFSYRGKRYVSDGFRPVLCADNADPWGMGADQQKRMGGEPRPFALMERPDGIFAGNAPVQVIEDGEVYLAVEAFFALGCSRVRMEYRIYKNSPYVDVDAEAFFMEADEMLKLEIPVAISGDYIGQAAFGTDELFSDGRECVAHRFTAVRAGAEECLALLNDRVYGSSMKDGRVSLSLLRGATYCAHPLPDRALLPSDRYSPKIDVGRHLFRFRVAVLPERGLERAAQEFSQRPYAMNAFPVPSSRPSSPRRVEIDNRDVTLVAWKKRSSGEGYVFRLMNNSPAGADARLTFGESEIALAFGKYEVKTVLAAGGALTECREPVI